MMMAIKDPFPATWTLPPTTNGVEYIARDIYTMRLRLDLGAWGSRMAAASILRGRQQQLGYPRELSIVYARGGLSIPTEPVRDSGIGACAKKCSDRVVVATAGGRVQGR